MGFFTAMAAVGVGLSVVSSIAEGMAKRDEAESQAKISEYNALLSRMNADAAITKAKFDQMRHQKRAASAMGRMRARLGASGTIISEGAGFALQLEQASESALESALIGYEGLVAAGKHESQAVIDRAQAGIYEQRADSAMTTGILGAGSSLLTGLSGMQQSGMFAGEPPTPRTPLTSTFKGKYPG